MKIGTKSILFGAHQFIIHPLFLARAWYKLFGFPSDPRLWIAFFVHDWGYWGKPNMDGPEGESHPYLGAKIMGKLFGKKWHDLCLFHSRSIADKHNKSFSKLCIADKLAMSLEPWWLYLPRVKFTKEIKEYMDQAKGFDFGTPHFHQSKEMQWFFDVQDHLLRWVYEHKMEV